MGHKTLIDGVGYEITGGRCLDDGVGYSIQKGRTLVDGVGYDVSFGASGMAACDLAVGSSVFANVNGVRTEFLVVHQGLPSSIYDASCDGTWLLSKDCAYQSYWRKNGGNVYRYSYAHSYLNSTYLNSLDSNLKSVIKNVLIPHSDGGSSGAVSSGSSGLAAQIFLLSGYEVNSTNTKMSVDGAALAYFSGTGNSNANRIATYEGRACEWWLRSSHKSFDGYVYYISRSGSATSSASSSTTQYYRPAFILDSSAAIDPNTFDILG